MTYQYKNSGLVLKFSRTLLVIWSGVCTTIDGMEDFFFFGLQNEISMVIRNGNHILFWTLKYLGDSALRLGFPSLHVVCGNPNPNAKISYIGT